MKLRHVADHKNARGQVDKRIYAKESCKRCHGRGYEGFAHPVKGHHGYSGAILCRCLVTVKMPAEIEVKRPSLWKMALVWIKRQILGAERAMQAARMH